MRIRLLLGCCAVWVVFALGLWGCQAALEPGGPVAKKATLLPNAGGQNAAYTGVGRFRGSHPCTGFLLQTVETATEETPAYILTNGRCAGAWGTNEVRIDAPADGMEMVFVDFFDTQDEQLVVPARRVAYATSKHRDLALVELEVGYAQLLGQGVRPLTLAAGPPGLDDPIAVVGVPKGGVAESEAFLQLSECVADGQTDLIQGHWLWFDVVRNGCVGVDGGYAGAPLLSREDGRLLGLIHTSTIGSGDVDCYYGRPCEVEPSGAVSLDDTSYGVPLTGLADCFDEAGQFGVQLEGCPLDNGVQLVLEGGPGPATQPTVEDPSGSGQRRPVRWDVRVSGDAYLYYAYKSGPAGRTDCRSLIGYGHPRPVDGARLEDPLPDAEGVYVLCVLGGNGATIDADWQAPAHFTGLFVKVDTTPPALVPVVDVRDLDTTIEVEPLFSPPELSRYALKVGVPGDTDCGRLEGYAIYHGIPLQLDKGDGPQRVCVVGYDDAGNAAPPVDVVVP